MYIRQMPDFMPEDDSDWDEDPDGWGDDSYLDEEENE